MSIPKNKVDEILYDYRLLIGSLLLFFSLAFSFWRFGLDLKQVMIVSFMQMLFGRAVFNYCRKGRVGVGPGGLDKNADPVGRAVIAALAFFVYVVIFFLDFDK